MPYINGKGVKSSGPLTMGFSADLFMGRKNVFKEQKAPKESARLLVLDMLLLFFPSCSDYSLEEQRLNLSNTDNKGRAYWAMVSGGDAGDGGSGGTRPGAVSCW